MMYKAQELLRRYLEGRTQRLTIGSMWSDTASISHGVSQGESPASILFISYHVNGLLLSRGDQDTVEYLGYADDTCLLFSEDEVIDRNLIETTIAKVMVWSKTNGLLLNAFKSVYMAFNLRNTSPTRVLNRNAEGGSQKRKKMIRLYAWTST